MWIYIIEGKYFLGSAYFSPYKKYIFNGIVSYLGLITHYIVSIKTQLAHYPILM